MKCEDIFKAMENADDKMLEECENGFEKPKIRVWTKYATAAAVVCLVFAGSVVVLNMNHKSPVDTAQQPSSVYNYDAGAYVDEYDSSNAIAELDGEVLAEENKSENMDISADMTDWNNLNIYEQYNSFIFNDGTYFERGKSTVQSVGDYIEDIEIAGYSENSENGTQDQHTITAKLYEIKNISKDAAVYVKFADDENYYPYTNDEYYPETLGEFVNGLDLLNNISLSKAYNSSFGENNYTTTTYNITNTKTGLNLLFNNTAAPKFLGDDDNFETGMPVLDFSVAMPTICVDNLSITIYEDGYLCTNIMSVLKMYDIGKENVENVKNYVSTNFKSTVVTDEIPSDDSSSLPYVVDESTATTEIAPEQPEEVYNTTVLE